MSAYRTTPVPALLLVLALNLAAPLRAQVPQVLTREAFVQLVLDNHPLARQAALRTEMGDATVRSARGAFDPKATAQYNEKNYADKRYYQLLDAGLKVPTWYGVDLLLGYEENEGVFVDPQNLTPTDGLLKAGVQVPIGQGLFIDQRRATLRQAQAFQRANEGERQQLLNALLLQALNDHADWVAAYRRMQVSDSAVYLAQVRADAVRANWRGGDRPAIDTLEALLQVQDRVMRQRTAQLAFRNAGLRLSDHLWDAAQRPLELGTNVVPDPAELRLVDRSLMGSAALDTVIDVHPQLLRARARLEQLEVERRLRAEMLKPDLDLKYQWLGNADRLSGENGNTMASEGHGLGVGFSMPLFLRKERGELSLARLRYSDAELSFARDRLIIRNRVRERMNDIELYAEQVELGAEMVNNQLRLTQGETQRFNAGESSLFLVNQREVPLIDARLRQVDLEARLCKAWFALDNETGTLWKTIRP